MGRSQDTPSVPATAVGDEALVLFGKIVGLFGVAGELRVHLYNRESTLLHQGGDVLLISDEGQRRRGHMRTRSGAGARVLARLEGLRHREEARELIGWAIHVAEADLPATDDGEYYHRDLLGLEVYGPDGLLGKLVEIHSGQVDVWSIKGPDGVLHVPATREHVVEVDLSAGRIEVVIPCDSTS